MAITTIAQVLEHAEKFERMLAEFYANISNETEREGVRLLTDYMSRHRIRSHEILSKLPVDSADQIYKIYHTPLQYEPCGADKHSFDNINLSPDATSSRVLDAAIQLDECLVDFYKQVVNQPIDQNVKQLFEGLIQAEEYDEIALKKIKAMDYF